MNTNTYIVSVALDKPLFRTFDYIFDLNDSPDNLIGCRVEVPFATSTEIGLIVSCPKEPSVDISKLKKVIALIDDSPITNKDVIDTIFFAAKYYHYPVGQCFAVAMPGLLKTRAEAKPSVEEYICLVDGVEEFTSRSKKAVELFELLKKEPLQKLTTQDLTVRGYPRRILQLLVDKNVAKYEDLAIAASDVNPFEILKEEPPVANPEQAYAINTINKQDGFEIFLLNGITGSGKTEVYLQTIAHVLKRGKSVLVLVPEIALTPQTLERFYNRFNVNISVINSSLSPKERLHSHMQMLSGDSRILIGTRSALFTPIDNLGLIVIDEEHDNSFKQSDGFRYHARSLAIIRAQLNKCPIILGSATPSLESVYNCLQNKFTRLNLTQRAGGATPPLIEIIDLKNEPLTEGLKTGISYTLEDLIGTETVKGNQVLLFLNRRGYSHHLECHNCGHIFRCSHCDNPLTVHKNIRRLCCHVCNRTEYLPLTCPVCGSPSLIETGFGTEQVEQFLRLRYPDVGIERIDRDTIKSKDELEAKLERIKSGQSGILLGTQMLAKGHDFPNVTLVGIIDIDSGLYSDDFRAQEYTMQLVTQVAGRAGRAMKKGRVILQTHHHEDPFVSTMINPYTNYFDTATELLRIRQAMTLPPFSQQAFLLASSPDRERAHRFMLDLCTIASGASCARQVRVSPVVPDKMEKRNDRYHFHVLVSAANRQALSAFLDVVVAIIDQHPIPNAVRFAIEVDPQTMY